VTASALYEGEVLHDRVEPRRHRFRQRLYLLYLDLDELPDLFRGRWLWSVGRRNLSWFRREDYLEPATRPLDEAARDRVEAELGRRPTGPVRVLTHLRTLGYLLNPVSFYYCHDEQGRLDAVVAEITNTPWSERHAYVLDARGSDAGDEDELRWRFPKRFHVSPFHGMDQVYDWTFRPPGERLEVGMTNHEDGRPVFHAGLSMERRPLTAWNLARVLVVHPFMTLRVTLSIYWQALKLFAKRVPFHTHPDKVGPAGEPSGR
jgi:DUF1365 family protein